MWLAYLSYNLLLLLLLPFVVARLLLRGRTLPEYRKRLPERFGIQALRLKACIWVHAVSVGETMAAAPLIEYLKTRYPAQDILVTTTTPTGSECVHRLFGNTVHHCYAPYDLPWVVSAFLTRICPALIIIMETEVWPNLIAQANAANIPLVLANARLSERSARSYRRFPNFSRTVFKQISVICTQTQADTSSFLSLGVPNANLHTMGSLKFDLELPQSLAQDAKAQRQAWGEDRIIWIAASTHDNEEAMFLDVYQQLVSEYPNLLLVLVPRHPERFESVAQLIDSRGFRFSRRSLADTDQQNMRVILGDTMGELLTFFKASDFAVMGGSFVPVGGHNMLEPMACGLATLVGPHMFNFQSITQMLVEHRSLIQVRNTDQLQQEVERLCRNALLRESLGQRGAQMVLDNRGALKRLTKQLERLLPI